MPSWVQEGGLEQWVKRLKNPAIRQRVKREMAAPADEWENFYAAAGSPENIVLAGFVTEALKPLTGKTLAEVARKVGIPADRCGSLEAALTQAGRLDLSPPPRILITGSLYLAGEVLAANGTPPT